MFFNEQILPSSFLASSQLIISIHSPCVRTIHVYVVIHFYDSMWYFGFERMFVCLMVFNVTFNNISVISWRSVLLVEETRGPGENHRPVVSH